MPLSGYYLIMRANEKEAEKDGTKKNPGLHDCVIAGAGPGGLQAAIYLCRYCRDVLVLDRGGGRTRHARQIENFLTHPAISGRELIERGMAQAARFGARTERETVVSIATEDGQDGPSIFLIQTSGGRLYRARTVIVSTGAQDVLPVIGNLHKYFALSFFTCVDCDGYKTRGRKTVILGNSEAALRLALAVKQMYTKDITIVLDGYTPPPGYADEMKHEGIEVFFDSPASLGGEDELRSLELKSGRHIPCEAVLSNYGYRLNDSFLEGMKDRLKRDATGQKYQTNRHFESSLPGLYMAGPLAGSDQAIIAAGEGAIAALDINKKLIELYPA